jgi:hypothetical protein
MKAKATAFLLADLGVTRSHTGASGWRKPARLSASPSRPLLAAAMDASFRPASAGWLSGRSHG